MHDLVIRNGRVIDGTGAPAVLADVAVDGGRITVVGTVTEPGREEIDATGLDGHPRLRRRAHPLRRPGHLGPAAHPVDLARRHHRGHGQLRCGLRAGRPRPARLAHRPHGGRRGDPRRRAARGHPVGLGDRRRVPRRARPAAARDRRRRADRARRGARLRDGRARRGQRARDRRRHRAHGRDRAGRRGCRRHRPLREPPGAAQGEGRSRGARAPSPTSTRSSPSRTRSPRVRPTRCSRPSSPRPPAATARCGTSRSTGSAASPARRASRSRSRSARPPTAPTRGATASLASSTRTPSGARLVPQVGCHRQGLLCGLRTLHPFLGRPAYVALADLPVAERAARMADPTVKAAILAEHAAPGTPAPRRAHAEPGRRGVPVGARPRPGARSRHQPRGPGRGAGARPRRPPLRLDHRRRTATRSCTSSSAATRDRSTRASSSWPTP